MIKSFSKPRFEANSTSENLDGNQALDNYEVKHQDQNIIIEHINGYKVSTIKEFAFSFNYKNYPNNYPFYIEDNSTPNNKEMILQWAKPLDEEDEQELHEKTEYIFIDVFKVRGKTDSEIIKTFLNIDLNSLRNLLLEMYG